MNILINIFSFSVQISQAWEDVDVSSSWCSHKGNSMLVQVGVICGVVRKAGQINLVEDANLSKNQPSKCKLTSNNFLKFTFDIKITFRKIWTVFLDEMCLWNYYFFHFLRWLSVTVLKVPLFIAIFSAIFKTVKHVSLPTPWPELLTFCLFATTRLKSV